MIWSAEGKDLQHNRDVIGRPRYYRQSPSDSVPSSTPIAKTRNAIDLVEKVIDKEQFNFQKWPVPTKDPLVAEAIHAEVDPETGAIILDAIFHTEADTNDVDRMHASMMQGGAAFAEKVDNIAWSLSIALQATRDERERKELLRNFQESNR